MNRRKFIRVSGSLALGTAVFPSKGLSGDRPAPLKAVDVNKYLRSLCPVSEPTVDRIVIGDPETEVTKMGTCWMPYWKTLRRAVDLGINTLVTHEPAFYSTWGLEREENLYWEEPDVAKKAYLDLIQKKKRWITDHRLVIVRSHDVMDKVPEFGMPFALGEALGFSNDDIIRSRTYYNVYGTSPMPAIQAAEKIAARLKDSGQPGVAFYGDRERIVRSIGVGTGCNCDPVRYLDLKPDLFVAIDDKVRTWIQTTYAEDTGHPLVVINHGTSEEFGMRALNKRLRAEWPDYEILHLDQGCGYEWVTA